ncbi:hypothetical protein KR074_011251 [Drosophila pseudoananassae]|nr:hypothetical protein KR074_011251 [Drosophila pseudoananassae]
MRSRFGVSFLVGLLLVLALIGMANSSGKSRNREDRFDLEIENYENQGSNEIIDSCESSESLESSNCRISQSRPYKRKTFRFAL